jgi:hypothetical protein
MVLILELFGKLLKKKLHPLKPFFEKILEEINEEEY